MRQMLSLFALVLTSLVLSAQSTVQSDPPRREWKAAWVTHPTAPLREPVVLHFRRTLALATVPVSYPVRVSADNRFVLFVNGIRVGDGPARGDLTHWRYERFDLAPLLRPGQNVVAATVGILASSRRLLKSQTAQHSCSKARPLATTPSARQAGGRSRRKKATRSSIAAPSH